MALFLVKTLFVAVCLLSLSKSTEAVAVMSVDIGSEWMKIGIVSVIPPKLILIITHDSAGFNCDLPYLYSLEYRWKLC